LEAFVITLREGFEASLIIGLMFAYLVKTGQAGDYGRAVWLGTAGAAVTSVVCGAILFAAVGELEGTGEAVFEGSAMIFAAAVLTWMVFWMRRQSASIGKHLRVQVSDAVASGSALALAGIAFVAVAREGLETALFMFAAVKDSEAATTFIGATAGLVVAVALGVLLYRGAVRIDLRRFFAVTGLLVILIAAYLLFSGFHELGEAGGGEAVELIAPLAGLGYGIGFAWTFLRGLRTSPAAA
jgi:high-affinity iron transporter